MSSRSISVGTRRSLTRSLALASSRRLAPSIRTGWSNIVEKHDRAKECCDEPFAVRVKGGRAPVRDEWIGRRRNGGRRLSISIRCARNCAGLPAASLDAVFTNPPYFGNVGTVRFGVGNSIHRVVV
jgi:hypothetical protein